MRALFVLLVVAALPISAGGQNLQAYVDARSRMVEEEIIGAGIKHEKVIEALRTVPRHEFVPTVQRRFAYLDMALPIGESQTISPPFIVAYMTEQLDPQPEDKVLEIGTGSGYQAAVLGKLVREVYSIEIVPSLGREAAATLRRLGCSNVHTKIGDGYKGWPQHAPFDKIIVTCSPEGVPTPLFEQLKEGGRMVVPVGERYQQTLYLLRKKKGKLEPEALKPTLFVPMTGVAEEKRRLKPDGARPELRNGDFEEVGGEPPLPSAWHYQRQLTLINGPEAPSGKHYVVFRNAEPGRGAQALQGFALDGRKVKQIELSARVCGKEVRPSVAGGPFPRILLTFYDEKRATLGEAELGPWRGSFSWQAESARIAVPIRTREAIITVGLLGALGELAFDQIELKPVDPKR